MVVNMGLVLSIVTMQTFSRPFTVDQGCLFTCNTAFLAMVSMQLLSRRILSATQGRVKDIFHGGIFLCVILNYIRLWLEFTPLYTPFTARIPTMISVNITAILVWLAVTFTQNTLDVLNSATGEREQSSRSRLLTVLVFANFIISNTLAIIGAFTEAKLADILLLVWFDIMLITVAYCGNQAIFNVKSVFSEAVSDLSDSELAIEQGLLNRMRKLSLFQMMCDMFFLIVIGLITLLAVVLSTSTGVVWDYDTSGELSVFTWMQYLFIAACMWLAWVPVPMMNSYELIKVLINGPVENRDNDDHDDIVEKRHLLEEDVDEEETAAWPVAGGV